MMNRELNKYMGMEFPEVSSITKEVREQNATRIFTGGVRINNSMYRTHKEDEHYRKQVLSTKLP